MNPFKFIRTLFQKGKADQHEEFEQPKEVRELNVDQLFNDPEKFFENNPGLLSMDGVSVFLEIAEIMRQQGNFDLADHLVHISGQILSSLELPDQISFSDQNEVDKAIHSLTLASQKIDLEEFEEAKQLCEEALIIFQRLTNRLGEFDKYIAGSYLTLGIAHQKLDEFEESRNCFLESLRIFQILNERHPDLYIFVLARTLWRLGSLEIEVGDLENAAKYLLESIKYHEKIDLGESLSDLLSLVSAMSTLSAIFVEFGKYYKAKQISQRSMNLLRKLIVEDHFLIESYIAGGLMSLASIHENLDETNEALAAYEESIAIFRRQIDICKSQDTESSNLSFGLMLALGSYGKALGRFVFLGEHAKQAHNEALEICRELNHEPGIASSLNNLGAVESNQGNLLQAEQHFKEALRIRKDLSKKNSYSYESLIIKTLNNIGVVYIRKEVYKEAINYFEESHAMIVKMLDKVQDINSRIFLFQDHLNVYEGLLTSYVRLDDFEKAIEIAEQGKSVSLNDHLKLHDMRPKVSIELSNENKLELNNIFANYTKTINELQYAEKHILACFKELNDLQHRINIDSMLKISIKTELESQIEKAETKLSKLQDDRKQLLKQIQAFDPQYPPTTEDLNFEQILKISQESKRVIVMYRVLDWTTFIFLIFPDRTYKHFEVPDFNKHVLNEIVNKWNNKYREILSLSRRVVLTQKDVLQRKIDFEIISDQMFSNLKEIALKLIKPVRDILKNTNSKDVLFVPSGGLAILPIQACFDEIENRYLLEDFNITFSTSISLFKKSWEIDQNRQSRKKLMFVTNPRADLRYAEEEVKEICGIYGLDYAMYKNNLLRRRATKKAVQEKLIQDFEIVHFACHGSYNLNDPFTSQLLLAGNDSLSLKEIMETRLSHVSLVALSACETGLVDITDASDEHYGFPFSFLIAGSPTVWGTLWSVEDKATSILLQKAYSFLEQNKNKSEALRLAQIEMCKHVEYRSPYYWAGFQNFGA